MTIIIGLSLLTFVLLGEKCCGKDLSALQPLNSGYMLSTFIPRQGWRGGGGDDGQSAKKKKEKKEDRCNKKTSSLLSEAFIFFRIHL